MSAETKSYLLPIHLTGGGSTATVSTGTKNGIYANNHTWNSADDARAWTFPLPALLFNIFVQVNTNNNTGDGAIFDTQIDNVQGAIITIDQATGIIENISDTNNYLAGENQQFEYTQNDGTALINSFGGFVLYGAP